MPNGSVTGCQFTIPYGLIGSNWHPNWKVQAYINIYTYSTWELLFFWKKVQVDEISSYSLNTIDLTETGVQGLYRNFPGILVRELFQKKNVSEEWGKYTCSRIESDVKSTPTWDTEKCRKVVQWMWFIDQLCPYVETMGPFCKWFWSGFWVSQHLLTEYLEH